MSSSHSLHSISLDLDRLPGACVRSLREACLHWSDEHGEEDSLPSGVAGAQGRHEIPSGFVAQSLIGLSTGYGVTRS